MASNHTNTASARPVRLNPSVFDADSPNLGILNLAISELEDLEHIARRIEAVRLLTLAKVARIVQKEAEVQGHVGSAQGSLAYRAARADVAATLHLSEQTVERHLSVATLLSANYQSTLTELSEGRIETRHAQVIVDAGRVVAPMGAEETPTLVAHRSEYERNVLEVAVTTSPNRLKPIARRLAESFAFESLDARYEREKQHRSVWVGEREDGMADLTAYLPAHEAHAIHSRLTQMAKQAEQIEARERKHADAAQGEREPETPCRSRDAIRADLFADLLLNGNSGTASLDGPSVHGIVQIVAHESDVVREPSREAPIPILEGYGPIPVSVARNIAGATPAWNRVVEHPERGVVLSVDRYRPSAAMRRFLTARDAHCRFPGCRAPAHRCDVDHTVDAALGGPTSLDNLGMLCRGHHTLKHHTGWKVTQHPEGEYEWTSPTGRTHIDRPASCVRFVPVENADPPPDDRSASDESAPPGEETQLPAHPF
ncbi:MAG: DUF222 domain-containing protein [Leucobacter sp.]